MFHTKEQDKSPETQLNKTEISDLSSSLREYIKMLTKVRKAMHKQSKNFNKVIEDIKKKYQTEITRIQHQTDQTEERINEFKDRAMELIQSEEQNEKRMKKKKR